MTAAVREPKDGFFVFTKKGKAPRFHHVTVGQAQAEADRLAALNPGAKFIVMQAVSKHSVPWPTPAGPESGEGVAGSPLSPHVIGDRSC